MNTNNAWDAETVDLGNKYRDVEGRVNEYHAMRGHVETLISSWDSAKTAVKNGTTVTVLTGGAAVISAGVAYLSAGSFAPAAWLAFIAVRNSLETYSLDSAPYLKVMGAALSAMDTARSNIDAAYNGGTMLIEVEGVETRQPTIGYEAQYTNYLEMARKHLKVDRNWLDSQVNTLNITRPYYHDHHNSSGSGDEHVITRATYLSHWQVKQDLEAKYKCKGPCSVKFRSPHDAFKAHRTECGTGDDIGIVSLLDIVKLRRRSVGQGCGHKYYKCPGHLDREDVQKHEIRTCTKGYVAEDGTKGPCLDSDGDPLKYRRCMYWEQDHNARIPGMSAHSDDSSSDSEEEANAGGTDVMHACGIHDTSVPGDHSSTWICNESPCSNRQVPYCLAMCPYTGTHGTATTPMHVCNIHPTSAPGDHSSTWLCNESPCSNRQVPYCFDQCPEAGNHGTATTPMHVCEVHELWQSGDHSWQTSCSDTAHNSNGDSCQASGFYECVSHTPVYPAPPPTTVSCGGCSVSYDPQGSLAWRHEYIPCPRTRIAHDLACGESFYRCSNTNTCIWGWRHSSWNDDPEL